MKVKALQNFAHSSKGSFITGKEYDLPNAIAQECIRGGLVEIVKEQPETKLAPETKPAKAKE